MNPIFKDIYILIDSLSKAEKRYIKINLSNQCENTLKLKLFDAICRYKKASIIDFEKKIDWTKHLYKLKRDLYFTILTQLENYYSKNNIYILLRKRLTQIEILYEKKLFKQCKKLINQALKQALFIEDYTMLVSLKNLQLKIFKYSGEKTSNQYIEIFSTIQDGIKKIEMEYEFLKINSSLHALIYSAKNNPKLDEILFDLVHNPIFTKKNSLTSLTTTYLYNNTWLLYYNYCKNNKKLYFNTKYMLNVFLNNKSLIPHHINNYISAINNHTIACAQLHNKKEETDSTYQLLLDVPVKTEQQVVSIYECYSLLGTSVLVNFKKIDEILAMEDYVNKGKLRFGNHISKLLRVTIDFNLATIFFVANKLNKALFYINNVLQIDTNNIRNGLSKMINILNLLIHYELKNYNLSESLFLSYKRNLKNKTTIEMWFLGFYQELLISPPKTSFFREKEKELLLILPSEEVQLADYINLFVWLRVKHGDMSLSNDLADYYKVKFETYKKERLATLSILK